MSRLLSQRWMTLETRMTAPVVQPLHGGPRRQGAVVPHRRKGDRLAVAVVLKPGAAGEVGDEGDGAHAEGGTHLPVSVHIHAARRVGQAAAHVRSPEASRVCLLR